MLQDGAPGDGYHVKRGFSRRCATTKKALSWSYTDGWRPARNVVDPEFGADSPLTDRTLNPYVLAQVLRGTYDVAWQAPSWTSLLIFDIDRRFPPGEGADFEAELAADAARDAVLEELWDAFDFHDEMQPVVLSTPGGGYHVYVPLDRPWPAAKLRSIAVCWLASKGLRTQPGRLEVFPAGQRLRVPCGRGVALLVPKNPKHGDDLRLELRHATVREGRFGPMLVRDVAPLVRGFLGRIKAARRPLAEWLSDDSYVYDKVWGPWLARNGKKRAALPTASISPSQHNRRLTIPRPEGSSSNSEEPRLLYGMEYLLHVEALLAEGLWEEGLRHDAVLKLVFYWARRCGHDRAKTEALLTGWLEGFEHVSKDRNRSPRRFVKDSLREGLHYFGTLEAGGAVANKPRREGHLEKRDQEMLSELDLDVRPECEQILRLLKGNSDADGAVQHPVNLSSHILRDICGERRIRVGEAGGVQRRRATVLAIEQLVRVGVLVLHTKHSASHHGRLYTCWYRFGSGTLPCPAEDGTLVLAMRKVDEGKLEALSMGGRPALRLHVSADTIAKGAQSGAYRPWWLDLYRGGFSPAEFLEASPTTVVTGPWDRGPTVPLEVLFTEKHPVASRSHTSPAPNTGQTAPPSDPVQIAEPTGPPPIVYGAELGRTVRRLWLWERKRQLDLFGNGAGGGLGRSFDRAWRSPKRRDE